MLPCELSVWSDLVTHPTHESFESASSVRGFTLRRLARDVSKGTRENRKIGRRAERNDSKAAKVRLRNRPAGLTIAAGLDVGTDGGWPMRFTFKLPFTFTSTIDRSYWT